MKGYVVGDIEVTDPELYQQYASAVPGSLEPFGGRYLVRGGQVRTLEGDWQPRRCVVIEFDSPDQARGWYESPRYQELAAIRQRAASGSLVLLEGYEPTI